MQCREARVHLELLVLGGLSSPVRERLQAHLDECPECRAGELECRRLVGEIRREGGRSAVRPEFQHELRSAVRAEARRERWKACSLRVAALGSAAALCLAACALWVHFHGGSVRDGGLQSERWQYRGAWAVPGSMAAGIVIEGPRMYLVEGDGPRSHVAAIDAGTGKLLWESSTRSVGYIAADRRRVYCLASPRWEALDLVALDAAGGGELWRYRQESPPGQSGPCGAVPLSSERLSWTHHDTVHLVDAGTGKAIWSRSVAGEGSLSCAVVQDDRIFVATGQRICCLQIDSGAEAWAERLEGRPSSQRPLLALGGGRLYCLRTRALESELSCMDLETRRVSWKKSVPPTRWLLAADQSVYLRGKRILALDQRTGNALWDRAASGCGPLTVVNGLLHFVDSSRRGGLLAVDRQTGQTAWEIAGLQSCDAFAKVGDTAYLKTRDGVIHAFLLQARG